MKPVILFLGLLVATPAFAGVQEATERHILPAFERFETQSQALDTAARRDCRSEALRQAYHAAFDAWLGISHLSFGPLETDGRALAIAFWPDTRGVTPRVLGKLISDQDRVVESAAEFATVSVAARGLFALEHLLFDAAHSDYPASSYTCDLVQAISADLAGTARQLQVEWQGYARILTSGGAAGNATYLSPREAAQEIYTALLAGLEFTKNMRLGRPLGTFERPRPRRAEARRSERSLHNVSLSLKALRDLARQFSDHPLPMTEQAFDFAFEIANDLDDPVFAGVSDPMGRLRVEILQQRIEAVTEAIESEIGTVLGLSAGFNSLDGD